MPFEAELRSLGIELPSYEVDDRYYTTCPKCSHLRKKHHQKLKVVHVTIAPDKFHGGCNHCGWTFPEKGFRAQNAQNAQQNAQNAQNHAPTDRKGTIRSYGPDLQKVFNPPGRQPKCYWQHRENGKWVNGRGPHDVANLLYRLEDVHSALRTNCLGRVLIVEGEKDVDTCFRLGFAATCNAHGASEPGKKAKWTKAHSAQLRGVALVVLNDNDPAGYAHADAVCKCSIGIAASVRRLDLKDHWDKIGPGDDISDWASFHDGTELEALVVNAPHYQQPTPPPTPPTPPASSDPPWLQLCILSDARIQRPLPVLHNVCIGLENDPAFMGKLSFNEMAQKSLGNNPGHFIEDDDITVIQDKLQTLGLRSLSRDVTAQAIDHIARKKKFHPLRDYLDALTWDGVERIDEWLHAYLGAENTDYARAVGRMFLISMVARIFKPGCKADYMLILEGPQGEEKSKACAALAGEEYFSDHLPDLTGGKDVSMHLRGKWLIEVPELHAFSKAEATLLKSFLSRQREQFRPPFGRMEVDEPRQCVFIGTSNKDAYLRDETGGRRFWPVKCGTILVGALATDRDHLFAEAVWAFKHADKWWPDKEFERQHIRPQQDARYEADVWTEKLEEHLAGILPGETVTVRQLAKDALYIEEKLMDARTEKRIVSVLQSLGYTPGPRTHKHRLWVKPTS